MISLDRASRVPLGDQLVAALARQVENGLLAEGARLPSLRQLAKRLSVSAFTVVNAYDRLVAQGLIESRPGSGYFVRRRRHLGDVADIEGVADAPVTTLGFALNALEPRADAVLAGSGFLPVDWLADALPPTLGTRVLREAALSGAPAAVQGLRGLREGLAAKLQQQGIAASPAQILVTYGATHAYDILMRTLARPGEAVLVDDPGYLVLHAQLQAYGLRLLAVPRNADGPDLDALEELAKRERPKLFFTQTLLHNPTGGSMAVARCHRLLGLAERHGFDIVEDDVYGDLARPEAIRLGSLDEFRRVFYVASFTKVLSPALRVGYLVAPAARLPALIEQKMLGVLTGTALQESLVAEVLASGRYLKHLQKLRSRVARARAAALRALREAGVEIAPGDADGQFIWGRLPGVDDADRLVRAAHERGIFLAKGQMFSPTGGSADHFRFNVAHSADRRLVEFLAGLRQGAEVRPFPRRDTAG